MEPTTKAAQPASAFVAKGGGSRWQAAALQTLVNDAWLPSGEIPASRHPRSPPGM